MNEPIIVDCELVRRLRTEGKRDEADELVQAHQDCLRKNYENGRKEIHKIELKERKIKCMNNNLCIVCGKNKENIKILKCSACSKKNVWKKKLSEVEEVICDTAVLS